MPTSKQIATAEDKAQAILNPTKGLSDVQIIRKNYGYSQEMAESNAHQIMESQGVQLVLSERLKLKIGDKKVAKKIKSLLDASTPVLDKEGNKIAEIPNHGVQLETTKLYCKVTGAISDTTFVDNRSLHFDWEDGINSRAMELLERMDKVRSEVTQKGQKDINKGGICITLNEQNSPVNLHTSA